MTAQIKMTRKEAEAQMACFRQTFSSVRLLNEKAVLQALRTHSKRTELECRVLHEKCQLTTLDVTPQRAEQAESLQDRAQVLLRLYQSVATSSGL